MSGVPIVERDEINACQAHDDCFTCPFTDCIAVMNNLATPSVNSLIIARLKKQEAEAERVALRLRRQELAFTMERAGESLVTIGQRLGIAPNTARDWVNKALQRRERSYSTPKHRQRPLTSPQRTRVLYDSG